jgi:hypothetical protein
VSGFFVALTQRTHSQRHRDEQVLKGVDHRPFGGKGNFRIGDGHWRHGPELGRCGAMAQRVVVVITLGLALGIVAGYLTGLGGVRTGWSGRPG